VANGIEVITRLYEWTLQRKVAGSGFEVSGSIAEGEADPSGLVSITVRSRFYPIKPTR